MPLKWFTSRPDQQQILHEDAERQRRAQEEEAKARAEKQALAEEERVRRQAEEKKKKQEAIAKPRTIYIGVGRNVQDQVFITEEAHDSPEDALAAVQYRAGEDGERFNCYALQIEIPPVVAHVHAKMMLPPEHQSLTVEA